MINNHSFCKVCLGKYFTEENNIVCPIDGPVNRTFEGLNYVKRNNNRNKGNNKKRNSKNSIQSLIHKSNSHKELIKYKNSLYKKRKYNINLHDKMNNFINNSKNSLQFLNLTNRNQDLNLNLYSKKFFLNIILIKPQITQRISSQIISIFNHIKKSHEINQINLDEVKV